MNTEFRETALPNVPSATDLHSLFLFDSGKIRGPYTFQKIRFFWSEGTLSSDCLISQGQRWISLKDFINP